MPTSLWWNHLSDHPLVQWGITRGALQEASLPKGAIKKKLVTISTNVDIEMYGYDKMRLAVALGSALVIKTIIAQHFKSCYHFKSC